MKIEFMEDTAIPRLSWCAKMIKYVDKAIIRCGKAVEHNDHAFVEGAWNGEFDQMNFDSAIAFFGSGGKSKGDNMLFVTPSHTLERLYVLKTPTGAMYISNSLAFILEESKTDLDINYLDYEKDFHSILKGLPEYRRTIVLKQKNYQCKMFYYCNIEVDELLKVKIHNKPKIKDFKTYSHYKKSLVHDLTAVQKNANAKGRKCKYQLITTISKGYDSAACAALAKELGCDTAVTFNEPEQHKEDSGAEIAKTLGYQYIIEKNANDYRKNKKLLEAEYLASGELGTGIVFSAFDQEFKNKIVFIGEGGDRIWDRNVSDVNDVIRFSHELYSGTTLIEPRLRLGYIYLPVPFYAAVKWPSIHRISKSEEMKPWTLGNSYDRPIPRRMLEEMEVPRHMFGVEKIGAGFNYRFDHLKRIQGRMSPKSYHAFLHYYKKNKNITPHRISRSVLFLMLNVPAYANYFFRKMNLKISLPDGKEVKIENPFATSYLFKWGVYVVRKRYKV